MAEKYLDLQQTGTRRLHQLWFLKKADAAGDQSKIKADVEQAHNALEARMADVRHIEAELETIRQAHYAAGDKVNLAQGQ